MLSNEFNNSKTFLRTLKIILLMFEIKEERSGGAVDWLPKLQTTNLVGLPAVFSANRSFVLCSEHYPDIPSRVHIMVCH